MRHIEVEYQDGSHAFVDDYSLESLIKSNLIKQFFRPSERRWITIGIDAVRSRKCNYCGLERRGSRQVEGKIPLGYREKPPIEYVR